jgi:hypothetical protein
LQRYKPKELIFDDRLKTLDEKYKVNTFKPSKSKIKLDLNIPKKAINAQRYALPKKSRNPN